MRKLIWSFAFSLGLSGLVLPQRNLGVRPTESGGILSPEQASYDVLSYDLAVTVHPESRSIDGSLTVEARVVHPMPQLVLDLDSPLEVRSAVQLTENETPLRFERSETQIWIDFPSTRQPGETLRVRVDYGGKPREARKPPWAGGFIWSKTAAGEPWVAVACQVDGADLWWPNKDHPSDEPDRMDIRITVPRTLEAVSNGVLQSVREQAGGRRTFHWRVVNPINAYNVTLNIAPYRKIEGVFKSVSGVEFPVAYWVLPENFDQGKELFKQIREHLHFFEKTLGPYPFRNEKYGVAETPYLGMEHQTITAYGNNYRNSDYGFDVLHLHELAHEWWGNLVTVVDWRDYWLHEGFASYMEALYAESLQGRSALADYARGLRRRIRNQDPVAPRESRSTVAKYFVGPDYTRSDGDVNFKAALVLHTLRYLIGDEAFFRSLRRFAYPDESWEKRLDGSQCRFATTEDFKRLAEEISERDLSWFFEVYLRQPRLPRLTAKRVGGELKLNWEAPDGLPFPMPVDVRVDGRLQRVEMPGGSAVFDVANAGEIEIDPEDWVLRSH